MCKPVSYQSPSSSFQAATLPPSTSLASKTMGMCPLSTRYLAQDQPAKPAPAITTRIIKSKNKLTLTKKLS